MQEMQESWVQSLGWEDPLEEKMAIHSSILSWRIPWTEEPGELQSMTEWLGTAHFIVWGGAGRGSFLEAGKEFHGYDLDINFIFYCNYYE